MRTSRSLACLVLVLACDLGPGSIGNETESAGDSGAGSGEIDGGCGEGCADGEFCAFPIGVCGPTADAPGECQSLGDGCLDILDPVCGCNGVTYGNGCEANWAGIAVLHEGACGSGSESSSTSGDESGSGGSDTDSGGSAEMCDGIAGLPCPEGEFCYHEPGVCIMVADAIGECRPFPENCVDILEPVCGCDGEDYGNGCEAELLGVNVATEGPCDTGGDALCTSTGGSWIITSCGHYNCGVPPACAAVIPGCDCGSNANFVDDVGCMADPAC